MAVIDQEVLDGEIPDLNTRDWESVEVPHDWAINGEFDRSNDIVIQEVSGGENIEWTGATGGLPHIGVGWYRKIVALPQDAADKKVFIQFDGAMSHAKVFCNGRFVGERPYGYISFGFELTDLIRFGEENLIAVRLENFPRASRWYPGAGIYRNVRLVLTDPVHIPQWGTYVTTPGIEDGKGTVAIVTSVINGSPDSEEIQLTTEVYDISGKMLASVESQKKAVAGDTTIFEQSTQVHDPELWSPGNPELYKTKSLVKVDGELVDEFQTTFGFRYFAFDADNGFSLNGANLNLQGVCMHHDLGPLGVAVNRAAIKRQLRILQDMGVNAIRTAHNPPSPELLDLCDEMGFLVIDEAFDEWRAGKVENGYHTMYDQWAEKDLVSMIQRDRNHPSVFMWSIGNEIGEQWMEDGAIETRFLTDICHREDPTRPVTAGLHISWGALKNGMTDILDVVGWNYKPRSYREYHESYPHLKAYGSETVSALSSRGEYFFPAVPCWHCMREGYHSSSYGLDHANWSYTPDEEFAAQDSFAFIAGQFVWTGFDYLGEPTPYSHHWPARSSYFGIVDLAGIPKNRFYLYKSQWAEEPTLHLMPHWNWENTERKDIPVHCYTSFDKAELFVNGQSQGIRQKSTDILHRMYRLVWEAVPYEPGELKVIAFDEQGNPALEEVIRTAGEAHHIELNADREMIRADGHDMVFVTATVKDELRNYCPNASHTIHFDVEGAGELITIGSGDPTSLERYGTDQRKAFHGICVAYIRSDGTDDPLSIRASSDGLEQSEIKILAE